MNNKELDIIRCNRHFSNLNNVVPVIFPLKPKSRNHVKIFAYSLLQHQPSITNNKTLILTSFKRPLYESRRFNHK